MQGTGREAPPDLQDQYKEVVTRAVSLIHGSSLPDIIRRIKSRAPAVTPAIAETSVDLTVLAGRQTKESLGEVSAGVLFHAMNEVAGNVIEVARAAGLVQENDPSIGEKVFYAAALIFGQKAAALDLVSPEEGQSIADYLGNESNYADAPDNVAGLVRGGMRALSAKQQGGGGFAQPIAGPPGPSAAPTPTPRPPAAGMTQGVPTAPMPPAGSGTPPITRGF